MVCSIQIIKNQYFSFFGTTFQKKYFGKQANQNAIDSFIGAKAQ